jgi:hypothetical protein
MSWFRAHIRHGRRLALLALAVQFVLAFGHFHVIAAPAAISVASSASVPAQPAPDPDSDSADGCAICAVMAMAGAQLVAVPPVLALPIRVALLEPLLTRAVVACDTVCGGFQARAPPLS